MLMLKNCKQLRKDEVKHTPNLPFSPIPHMNLLLMLPYVYLRRFLGLFCIIPPKLYQGHNDTFSSWVAIRNFIANVYSYDIIILNLRTLPGVLTLVNELLKDKWAG